MIKISFSVKRNLGKKGIVRLRTVSNDKLRLRDGQLVITPDGMGTIVEHKTIIGENGKPKEPHGVKVKIRTLKYKARIYKLTDVNVIDIIDNKTGDKYPASESDYSMLLADQTPVEFIVTRKNRAMLTAKSREQLAPTRIFAKKQNGIKILNELIEKGLWNLKKK